MHLPEVLGPISDTARVCVQRASPLNLTGFCPDLC